MLLDYHTHYHLWEPERTDPNPDEDKNIERMKKDGVFKACMSGSNTLVERLWKKHTDFVIPFIYIRMGTDKPELIDRYAKKGFKGIKFHLPAFPYDDERCFKYYEKAEKLGLPTLFHTAICANAGDAFQKKIKFSSEYTRPMRLDRVARCFPELTIVGAHMGYPWHEEAFAFTRWIEKGYFDLCLGQIECYKHKEKKWAVKADMKMYYDEGYLMPEKFLYGSDVFFEWPADRFKRGHAWAVRTINMEMDLLKATPAHRKMIMAENARKILKV